MIRNDKLFEESRIIRRAAKEGKTTIELMEMLSLSVAQIKYRVETRYSAGIARNILNKLEENDGKVKENTQKVVKKSTNKSLVVDTSALGKHGAFEFIMTYSSVILTLEVVKELEKRKSSSGILGRNIRKLLAESAKDTKGRKFKIEITKAISNYTDENLLNFCKGKDVILYTADNAMATMARAYEIEYLLAEDILNEEIEISDMPKQTEENVVEEIAMQETVTEELAEEEELTGKDIKQLLQDIQSNFIVGQIEDDKKTNVSNVSIVGKNLFLTLPLTYKIAYVVLQKEVVKKPIVGNTIKLEKSDVILVMTYSEERHNGLCIARYEIIDIQPENHAIYLGADKISNMNQIESLDLPKEAKREIRNYFSLVRNN